MAEDFASILDVADRDPELVAEVGLGHVASQAVDETGIVAGMRDGVGRRGTQHGGQGHADCEQPAVNHDAEDPRPARPDQSRSGSRLGLWTLVVLAVSVAGCDGCGSTHPLRADTPANSAPKRAIEDADAEPLVVVLPRDAQQLDPRFIADPYGLKVSRLIYASLVTIDPHTLEPIPDLAKDIEIETPTRYRVQLRKNLKFSDGSTLDATDVAATFRSVVDPDLGSRYARTYRRITRIETPDAHTVVFRLREPHAPFLTDLELPVMPAEHAEQQVGGPEGPTPIGAGPYRLIERVPGRMELAPNPHWHGGPEAPPGGRPDAEPRFPRVRMLVVRDDNTRALRMLAGGGDLALNAIPPLLLPMLEDDPRFDLASVPGVSTTYVGLNTEAGPLSRRRVRRALAYAIDRRTLMETELGGRARLARGWIPPGHWAYAEDARTYSHDPARARELLDAAGLRDPDGPGGEPRVRFVLRTSTDRFRLSVARAIAGMLRNVGVRVDVRPSETATLIADLNHGRFEMTMLQVPEVIEPHVLSWFFASHRIPGPERSGGANRWRYESDVVDAAFKLGRRRPERSARRAAYTTVQRHLARDLPVIPLWHEDVVAVRGPRAAGFEVPRDGRFSTLAW